MTNKENRCAEMATLSLPDGSTFLVDAADVSWCQENGPWHGHNRGYVTSTDGLLHRRLVGCPAGLEVDHINGNRRDNRRENLRLATATENRRNGGIRSDNTSGVVGVSWCRVRGKWSAQIKLTDRKVNLGRFDSFEAALDARRTAELAHFGEFSARASRGTK